MLLPTITTAILTLITLTTALPVPTTRKCSDTTHMVPHCVGGPAMPMEMEADMGMGMDMDMA